MPAERNLYKRGGVWWLRATIRGTEVRESLRTRDVRAARKLRDERVEAVSSARWHGKKRISWKDAVTAWASQAGGQIAATTAKRYAVSLLQVEAYLAPFDIDQIDGKAIQTLVSARRMGSATNATIRRDLTAVSAVLTFAEGQEWREGNPTLSKRRLIRERRDPIALPDPAAIEAVLAVTSARFGALIRAAEVTGCRQAELVGARWRDFNARAGTLEIVGKGNKRRTIPLGAEAAAHFSTQPRTLGSDLIFCRDGGQAFAEAASDFSHFRRAAEAKAKAAKQPFRRFRFHDLRHLFAVRALRDGMGIYTLSKYLGHTSVKTTEESYLAFLTPEEAERAKAKSA